MGFSFQAMFDDDDWFVEGELKQGLKRKWKKGSILDIVSKQHLPKGPGTAEELFNYPESILKDAFVHGAWQDRCKALLSRGVVEHSDYSGVFAEREAKRLLFEALRDHCAVRVPHMVTKTCDSDLLCQDVLLHSSSIQDDFWSCVFTDIRSRIHPDAQAWCDAALPKCDDPLETRQHAYDTIISWLLENSNWAVDQDSMLRHH